MAKVQPKAAPVAETNEGAIQINSNVIFLGYPEGTAEADMILTEGASYPVIALPGVEKDENGDDVETGYIVQVPNPKYNPKKKANPETNPEFFEAEVFENEIEPAGEEEGAEGEEEADVTYEELAAMDKAALLAFAKENEVKLTVPQKKSAETILAALAAEFGLEPAAEEEQEEQEEEAPADEGTEEEGAEEGDITYEEVQALDKAALLALAKENEVKLTLPQKKTEQTLRDALCAEFGLEPAAKEEAPAKPAAKAAAKAKAADKAPAGKAAAGKATAPAKGKATAPAPKTEEATDELPDLEGEDASVLALIAENEDLIAVAQELEGEVATSEYRLGGVLYHIKKKGEWVDLNPEYKATGGFALFVSEYFNVDYRKAQYLIDIYVSFTQAGITDAAEVVASIGWTKASKLTKALVADDADVAGLLEAAQNNTVADLGAIIKDTLNVGGTPGTSGTPLNRTTLKFRYVADEAKQVEDILKVIAEQNGVDEQGALLYVLQEWAVQNNVETVAKAQAAAKPAAKAAPTKAAPAKAAPARTRATAK